METFKWCIQSKADTKDSEIVSGFIHRHSEDEFPVDVLRIIQHFYCSNLFTLRDVQHAPYKTQFTSPIFELNSLRWYFEMWPR